jgi:hypothetical protein
MISGRNNDSEVVLAQASNDQRPYDQSVICTTLESPKNNNGNQISLDFNTLKKKSSPQRKTPDGSAAAKMREKVEESRSGNNNVWMGGQVAQ